MSGVGPIYNLLSISIRYTWCTIVTVFAITGLEEGDETVSVKNEKQNNPDAYAYNDKWDAIYQQQGRYHGIMLTMASLAFTWTLRHL